MKMKAIRFLSMSSIFDFFKWKWSGTETESGRGLWRAFSKVCVFIENGTSFSSFSCGRDMKTQQLVCVFKWKRIRVDGALDFGYNTNGASTMYSSETFIWVVTSLRLMWPECQWSLVFYSNLLSPQGSHNCKSTIFLKRNKFDMKF